MFNNQPIVIAALCLSACSTVQTPNPILEDAPLLLNTSWREAAPSKLRLSFRFSPRDNIGIPSIPEYNSPEGLYHMGGTGGCNSEGAGYLQNGWNLISTGEGMSTLKDCGRWLNAQDDRLDHALANVRTFEITKHDRLILRDMNGRKLLTLKRDIPK